MQPQTCLGCFPKDKYLFKASNEETRSNASDVVLSLLFALNKSLPMRLLQNSNNTSTNKGTPNKNGSNNVIHRSNQQRFLIKKNVLKNFAKLIGKKSMPESSGLQIY